MNLKCRHCENQKIETILMPFINHCRFIRELKYNPVMQEISLASLVLWLFISKSKVDFEIPETKSNLLRKILSK